MLNLEDVEFCSVQSTARHQTQIHRIKLTCGCLFLKILVIMDFLKSNVSLSLYNRAAIKLNSPVQI